MEKTTQSAPKSSILARVGALIAGVFASGVTMTAEERTQLEAAEALVRQEGDAVADAAKTVITTEATETVTEPAAEQTVVVAAEPETAAQLAALQEQVAAMEAQIATQTVNNADSVLSQWGAEGFVTPAAQGNARALLQHSEQSVRDTFAAFVTANGVHTAFVGSGAAAQTVPAAQAAAVLSESNDATNGTLHQLALAKIKSEGKNAADFHVYQAALHAVAKENPTVIEANREAVPSL